MGKDWVDIRIKVPQKDFDKIRTRIQGWPDEVMQDVYMPAVRAIAASGREYIRRIIDKSTTKTGEARAAAGGNGPGRVDTGDMRRAVGARTTPYKSGKGFSMFIGWVGTGSRLTRQGGDRSTTGAPGYAIFQEHGTKNGVEGMEAISQAEVFVMTKLRALASGKYVGHHERWED